MENKVIYEQFKSTYFKATISIYAALFNTLILPIRFSFILPHSLGSSLHFLGIAFYIATTLNRKYMTLVIHMWHLLQLGISRSVCENSKHKLDFIYYTCSTGHETHNCFFFCWGELIEIFLKFVEVQK